MTKTVLTNFRLDEETHKKFKIWCIENDTTLADYLRSTIDNTLAGKVNGISTKRPHKKKESELSTWLEEWD